MSYHSIEFLGFVGVVLLVYYAAGRRRQTAVLALANLAFYAIAGLKALPFLLTTALVTFLAAKRIGGIYREYDERIKAAEAPERKALRAEAKARAKKALAVGMIVAIGLLAVCKYAAFVLENLNAALGLLHIRQLPVFRLLLPLGISFYTFMALGYLLDVYWKRYPAEDSPVAYFAFLSFFPHVVQGPIDRYNEFKRQLEGGVTFSYDKLASGAQLMMWGFFKKLVVADRLGLFVDATFGNWSRCRNFVLIAAVITYSIQIYADFSGCIDIVTGVAEMMGITLRKNFNHPYFSRSMGEFWRRWHMSLQEWFKDYIYFPVSTSAFVKNTKRRWAKAGKTRAAELFGSCFPILVVWLVSGIWHGAAWKYVVWGLFHAALLISSAVFEPVFAGMNRRLGINVAHPAWRAWQMLRTFALCCLGRVFFRADDLRAAFGILRRMARPHIVWAKVFRPSTYGMCIDRALVSIVAVIILIVVDAVQERIPIRETLNRRGIPLRWALAYGCLFAIIIFGMYGHGYGSAFIYERY